MCLAIPGQVINFLNENESGNEDKDNSFLVPAKVRFGKVIKEIYLVYTPEVKPGDYVIVHAGFAISKISEEVAVKNLKDLGVED